METLTNKTLTSPVITTPTGIVKADVGLTNVDNTSDATKNSATVTLTNKTLTSPVINTSFSGTAKATAAEVTTGSDDTKIVTPSNASGLSSKVETLTNKTIVATSNTISAIDNTMITNRTRRVFAVVNGGMNLDNLGTPVLGAFNGGNNFAYLLDAAATEGVFYIVGVPADLSGGTFTPKVYWAMETATSGNVKIDLQAQKLRDGSAIAGLTELGSHSQTVAVPATSDTIKVTTYNTISVAAGDLIQGRFLRMGADAADTAAGDLGLFAIAFEYTADM